VPSPRIFRLWSDRTPSPASRRSILLLIPLSCSQTCLTGAHRRHVDLWLAPLCSLLYFTHLISRLVGVDLCEIRLSSPSFAPSFSVSFFPLFFRPFPFSFSFFSFFFFSFSFFFFFFPCPATLFTSFFDSYKKIFPWISFSAMSHLLFFLFFFSFFLFSPFFFFLFFFSLFFFLVAAGDLIRAPPLLVSSVSSLRFFHITIITSHVSFHLYLFARTTLGRFCSLFFARRFFDGFFCHFTMGQGQLCAVLVSPLFHNRHHIARSFLHGTFYIPTLIGEMSDTYATPHATFALGA